ncbi:MULTISPECIES: ATP-binding protein [Streptomyces]|uniref:ATP-binding protein n=1 Tax=Streptomyces venezuelae TaxID=54571 RepID=A0A5P2ASB7_STRVZ|nr:ATP-binding protein [Streptomyces venezuelae]QES21174.1 hypothetical protein DEJ46_20360 [Streptomyces venezuelae]
MNQKNADQLHSLTRHFSVLLSPTPRGARLARLLAAEWMRDHEVPLVTHDDVLRIEVTDTRGENLPRLQPAYPEDDSGRGLLLVEALADRRGVGLGPVPRKTVWAELDLPRP